MARTKEEKAAAHRAWIAAHPGYHRDYKRAHPLTAGQKAAQSERMRRWKAAHPGYDQQWRSEHREEWNAYMRDFNAAGDQRHHRAGIRAFVFAYKSQHPCVDCGEADPVCLDFDHRDPALKVFAVARAFDFSLKRVQAEIAKCDVRCANCHRKKTAKNKEGGYARKRKPVIVEPGKGNQ
jgi:hypothetical protein